MEFKLTNKTKLILGIVGGVLALALVIGGAVAISNAARKKEQKNCEHDYSESIILKEATCTSSGIKVYTCSKCDKEETEEIPAYGHTETKMSSVLATCYSTGLTDGVKCAACGVVMVEQIKTPILSHNVVVDKAVDATCTASGLTDGSHCQRCGLVVKKQETVPASGHNVVMIEGKAPTCTVSGKTEGSKCSRCNTIFSPQESIAPLGHDVTTRPRQEATCVEDGWEEYSVCQREGCGYTTFREIPATGHTIDGERCVVCGFSLGADHVHAYIHESVTRKATCVQAGILTKTCECGAKITESISATGHDYMLAVLQEATCITDGVQMKNCKKCGESNRETILALGHDYTDRVTTPVSCTTDGMRVRYCNTCTYSVTEKLTATGHEFGAWETTTPATCIENGTKTQTCVNCGLVESQNILAYGHGYDSGLITIAPTCTGKGIRTYTCGSCGDAYTEELQAYGHTISNQTLVLEPTCIEYGEKNSLCGTCGEIMVEVLTATGHTYENGTCTDCGETIIHEGLSMVNFTSDGLTMINARPEVKFSGYIQTSMLQEITLAEKEFGVIMVSEATITKLNPNEYVDWMQALKEAGAIYEYKTASLEANPTGSYYTKFSASRAIAYEELNTRYVSIPCIKTTSGGIEAYQYAQVITADNAYTNYPVYARSATSLIHSKLNAYAYSGQGMTSAEVSNAEKWLNEAVDLAKGLSAPDSKNETMKVIGTSNINFTAGSNKTLSLTVTPIDLEAFGLTWEDVLVKTELVSGKVARANLDASGKLTISASSAGVTKVNVYFWGVKCASLTATVT